MTRGVRMVLGAVLAVGLAGCGMSGDYTSPGNRKSLGVDRVVTTITETDGVKTTVVNRTVGRYVANGQNSDVGEFSYDGETGKLSAKAIKIEDKVAGEQGLTAREVSKDTKETMIAGMQTVASLVPLFTGGVGGGSGVSLPGVTGTAAPASPTLALAREAALQRIAACPFMAQPEKDRLSALVPLAPESVLVKILASLPTSATTKPE